MAGWEGMGQEEREKVAFGLGLFVVPKELGVYVRKGENKKGNLEMWRGWGMGKRGELVVDGDGEGEGDGEDNVQKVE